MAVDLLTVGESMLRFSVPPGDLLVDAPRFDVRVAGTESNVAVAVSRMGHKARWLSRMTDNPLGRRIVEELTRYGVDCSGVSWRGDGRVGIFYAEFGTPPRPTQIIYDRHFSSASTMHPATFDLAEVANARMLHLTGITPALSDACFALTDALLDEARKHDSVTTVFDVNYRAKLWDPATAADRLEPLLIKTDVLICKQEDAVILFRLAGDPENVARDMGERFGIKRVILTLGEKGALGLDNDNTYITKNYTTTILDRTGAGDTFAAGVITGLLEGNFTRGLEYGVAMSALQLTLHGDLFRLTRDNVLDLVDQDTTSSRQLFR